MTTNEGKGAIKRSKKKKPPSQKSAGGKAENELTPYNATTGAKRHMEKKKANLHTFCVPAALAVNGKRRRE
jgi:hypothetical protein